MQVYVIGRDDQAAEIDAADAAWRFMAWLANGANRVLPEVVQARPRQPPREGRLGALAESGRGVVALRTGITDLWPRVLQQCEPAGREAR